MIEILSDNEVLRTLVDDRLARVAELYSQNWNQPSLERLWPVEIVVNGVAFGMAGHVSDLAVLEGGLPEPPGFAVTKGFLLCLGDQILNSVETPALPVGSPSWFDQMPLPPFALLESPKDHP